jgi:hypothetical protein
MREVSVLKTFCVNGEVSVLETLPYENGFSQDTRMTPDEFEHIQLIIYMIFRVNK